MATALGILATHTGWSMRDIAREAGYASHSSLSRAPDFKEAWDEVQKGQALTIPKGYIDGDTPGGIEATE